MLHSNLPKIDITRMQNRLHLHPPINVHLSRAHRIIASLQQLLRCVTHTNHKTNPLKSMSSPTFSPPLPLSKKSPYSPSLPPLHYPKCVLPSSTPPLPIHRSKMILTRRIFSWTLRKRRAASHKEQREASQYYPHTPLAKRTPLLTDPPPLEAALWEKEPVPTFVFHRGLVFSPKRRAGDPPSRYLEVRYGMVEPFSPGVSDCSNPRTRGMLRDWYDSGRKWNCLQGDFRGVLKLEQRKRVGEQFGGSGGVRRLADGRTVERKWLGGGTGPLLVESRWERALGKSPRLIVVGDIHGCITEFQALLRLADYQPGDQVVLLGDLVAKGPDSVGVVQMAREIGAKMVRGNHDFEVVRWWEARARGDGQTMVSMEHAKIGEKMGIEEHHWLVDAPWFIECVDMGFLFVHAGFIPGVKLTQQNPRLMMNMRSVLKDGTVTAKNVGGCEWAKLWKGPQTVVFGHDAFRGLQQYEYALGIDTGCVYGGRLTALLLPENRMVSVAAKKAYISPKKFRGGSRMDGG